MIGTFGIGKVIDVEHFRNDFGQMDPDHTILLNGSHRTHRTVNDLEPTSCTEEHRWDPHMKWCADCVANELGEPVELSV